MRLRLDGLKTKSILGEALLFEEAFRFAAILLRVEAFRFAAILLRVDAVRFVAIFLRVVAFRFATFLFAVFVIANYSYHIKSRFMLSVNCQTITNRLRMIWVSLVHFDDSIIDQELY